MNAIAISAGDAHTCALSADAGSVFCWGDNSAGQLGDGTLTGHAQAPATPVVTNALGITAGRAHTCALMNDHTVMCWGDNEFGQLGEGTPLQSSTPQPTQVPCP